MIRKGIWAKGPFSPGTSGPFPLHPLTCSWPINEVTFGMNRGVSPPLHRRPWHISLYIKHFHKLMGWCIHTQTHTPFLKDTSTCGGILAQLISPPLSLSLSLCACWVGTAHLAPAFGSQLSAVQKETAWECHVLTHIHPRHPLPKELVSIMISAMR